MATTFVVPTSSQSAEDVGRRFDPDFGGKLVTGLTVLALMVHGYHPYAEDGGLYMAEVKRLLDPSLYPHGTEFVTGHLRVSLFGPMVVGLVRGSHLNLDMVLFLLHVASYWVTLFASWLLAAKCYRRREARIGAVALLATWITLPIAGTSLMLMDPYVTARSISTPCVLLALVGVLEFLHPIDGDPVKRRRGLALCCLALTMAAAMHPLMAAYGLGCVLVLSCIASPVQKMRVWGTAALCLTALGLAASMQTLAAPESPEYLRVAMTRYYWFPGAWHWYEQFGLAAPLIILAIAGAARHIGGNEARVALARMAVVCGVIAVLVTALFARVTLHTHLVARLQPLRIFQIVYVVMILAVGAALAEWVLRLRPMRWIAVFPLLAGIMLSAQLQTFPNSAHLELPWTASQNEWQKAFLWIRSNTPKDALFALDAHYITSPGEDAQSFRAIAERSALPDYSKDGGKASITPKLTAAWVAGETAQIGLNTISDAQRISALRPLGVTWIVLQQNARTHFACDYANGMVKICRFPSVDTEQLLVRSGSSD